MRKVLRTGLGGRPYKSSFVPTTFIAVDYSSLDTVTAAWFVVVTDWLQFSSRLPPHFPFAGKRLLCPQPSRSRALMNGGSMDALALASEHLAASHGSDQRRLSTDEISKYGTKRFVCQFAGCGKAFTRGEHLSRHKLNHEPKEIFKCAEAGCKRTFVRLDLLQRHTERHAKRASFKTLEDVYRDSSRELGDDRIFVERAEEVHSLRDFGTAPTTESLLHSPIMPELSNPSPQPTPKTMISRPQDPAISLLPSAVPSPLPMVAFPPTLSVPTFGGDSYLASPDGLPLTDDFTTWLFNDKSFDATVMSSSTSSPMDLGNLLSSAPEIEAGLSEERWLELLLLLPIEARDAPGLRLPMCNHYIGSYFTFFHPQLPLLHRPTFSPNTTPAPLILAVMAYGAYHEDSTLARMLIQNLRWHVFSSPDFHPPAKLWVMQALVLIEYFEHTMASRDLHVIAHIFHATTLTLMRRGSSLSETNGGDDNAESIDAEATKRVALAAFVIDANHATVFGHALVMSVDEIKLSLPCDDSVWDGQSGRRRTMSFLSALKRVLNGHPVNTNTFGRIVLLHGLISVAWHMRQREQQNSSGVSLGKSDTNWRSQITGAVDSWKLDFDNYVMTCPSITMLHEYRHCLYHHSHINLSVSVVDIQIYAGAKTIIGRPVSDSDFNRIEKYMSHWATLKVARDAVLHAARLLREVVRDGWEAKHDRVMMRPWGVFHAALIIWSYGYANATRASNYFTLHPQDQAPYSAMNGSNRILHPEEDWEQIDFNWYVSTVGNLADADELEHVYGLARTKGVILWARRSLTDCGWELRMNVILTLLILVHEAHALLGTCVGKTAGGLF